MSGSNDILIIDDEPFLRMTLAAILERVGYQTIEAATAKEGLETVSTRPVALIFLDLQMPDRNGLEILPEIRTLQPQTPVLVLTANGTLEKAIEALRLGAREYMLKPVDPGEIITRVDDLLKEGEHADSEQAQREDDEAWRAPGQDCEVAAEERPPLMDYNPSRRLSLGAFSLDIPSHQVIVKDKAVELPACTFEYLLTLLRHSPEPVTFEQLVYESQGYELCKDEAQDLTRWRIYRLQKVLEDDPHDPRYLISVPGVGYKLVL